MRRATTKKNVAITTSSSTHSSFDLNTVKTSSNGTEETHRTNRLFGIQEAPTFYPTKDEFKDPMSYIEKISPEGEKYGIIKIVPPKDYHPQFSLKTENFRFKTRIQKLNSMEGETRTNVNYLEQLTKYHILTGKPVGKIPQLDKRPIDLYKLKNEVAVRGGVQEVTRLKKWAEIGRVLGYARKQCTSMSNALKTAYAKVILPYEIWYAKHKNDVEQVIKKDDNGSSSSTESDTCEICKKNENEEQLLLCDGCNRGYHTYCLNPPLTSIPKSDWYCIQCLTAVGKDYGFEDGEEYSLADFHKVCDKFKKSWFEKTHTDGRPVTEEECENEFWRLVENPHETCEVEYGADLHSTQHGSGFVTAEQMPKDAFDPWNLNVIPVTPRSLFTYIKSDISGMMIPWLYVGMCFSAFCWHNEDHYTYSINYMHWGETKTWYGIPGSDTAKFEETMKKAVPELFEQQPDLLFQLVTMLSPGRLVKEDVKVYAVDQRPGQFVVTFPKAYHSGFNHGFNFCEAVNFAPGEWVDAGLECVKRYKAFRKQPCFSHDNLLVTAAQHSKSLDNVDWLKRGLTEMQTRELKERQIVRSKKIGEKVIPPHEIREELQCIFCNCYTYLSYIGCSCTSKVACLDHYAELCTCDLSERVMCLQYTDSQLDDLVKSVVQADATPDEWVDKLDKAMSSRAGPSIKKLRDILKEGVEARAPQEALDGLKDFIETLEHWTMDAERLLAYKSDSKAGKRRIERAEDLLERAAELGYDPPQLEEIKAYLDKLNELESHLTDELFTPGNLKLQTEYYNQGLQLRSDSVRFLKLRSLIESSSWQEEVDKAVNTYFNAKNIRRLIKEAEDMGMKPEESPMLQHLLDLEEFGKNILQRIDSVCKGREKIDMGEEDLLLNSSQSNGLSVKLDPQILVRLKNNMDRSKELIKDIDTMINQQCTKPSLMDRPTVTDAQRYMSLCRELCFKTDLTTTLSNELSRMASWNERLRHTFMNGRQKSLETVLREVLTNVQRITQGEDKPGIWCICRKQESGLMIECEVCHEWYHSSCLKVPRNVVRSPGSYVCPICFPSDTAPKVSHLSRQPKLQEVEELVITADALKFRPKDYFLVLQIRDDAKKFKERVDAFCNSKPLLEADDVKQTKRFVRELMGLEIALPEETDFLQSQIQRLAPMKVPVVKAEPIDFSRMSSTIHKKIAPLERRKVLMPAKAKKVPLPALPTSPVASQSPSPITKKRKLSSESKGSTPERKLTTTVRSPSTKTVSCVCPSTDDSTPLIECFKCKKFSHTSCVYHPTSSLFLCNSCSSPVATAAVSNESNINNSPRLHLSTANMKRRSTEEASSPSPKPQKIIKLTVNPPAEPTKNHKKRHSSSDEDKPHVKKHKHHRS